MFKGKRNITQGIHAKIPEFMQNLIWYLIETMKVEKIDYLQVFELKPILQENNIKQKILHRQENPPYKSEYVITVVAPITAKIYVIDDGSICTMLLSGEY